jgi:hypothetical protein
MHPWGVVCGMKNLPEARAKDIHRALQTEYFYIHPSDLGNLIYAYISDFFSTQSTLSLLMTRIFHGKN